MAWLGGYYCKRLVLQIPETVCKTVPRQGKTILSKQINLDVLLLPLLLQGKFKATKNSLLMETLCKLGLKAHISYTEILLLYTIIYYILYYILYIICRVQTGDETEM